MCKKSKAEVKILKDRTKGLDARGNVAVNTQAESSWAVNTLSGLDAKSAKLLSKDLKRVHDDTKKFRHDYQEMRGQVQRRI